VFTASATEDVGQSKIASTPWLSYQACQAGADIRLVLMVRGNQLHAFAETGIGDGHAGRLHRTGAGIVGVDRVHVGEHAYFHRGRFRPQRPRGSQASQCRANKCAAPEAIGT
jgi:hypothetical protein